jgi:optic atrophy protein 1
VIRKNLEARGVKADLDIIKSTWFAIYRQEFLDRSLNKTFDCRKGYWIYSKGVEGEVMVASISFVT